MESHKRTVRENALKKSKKIVKYLGIIILGFLFIGFIFPTWTPSIKEPNTISSLEQVFINGTKLQLMVRGNLSKTIVIFVHGGPGCSEIPYVRQYQKRLEEEFLIVHYDQRASGKSYHFFEDYTDLSSDLLVEDLIELTDYLSAKYGQEKVLLLGHSFGTYIGMQAAARAPNKYTAYVGIGQMATLVDSEIDSLEYCLKQAIENGDVKEVAEMEALREEIQKEEILMPRNYVRQYGGASRLIDDNKELVYGMLFHSEYNLLDIIRYIIGANYSQNILLSNSKENNLPMLVQELEIPCYFLMGDYDYMTSSQSAKKYFEVLKAPKKEFISYSNSAHFPQFEEKEIFIDWMIQMFQ